MANQPPFAEYPRPNLSFGRGPGVYFDAIGESWTIVRQDLGTWLAATLIMIVLTLVAVTPILPFFVPSYLAATQNRATSGQFVTATISYFLLILVSNGVQSFFLTGLVGMGVRKLRGETIEVGMVFDPFRSFGRVLGTILLFSVILFAASLVCGLPVLYFGPVLLLMPTVSMLQTRGATDAFSTTFAACKAHWGGLLGLSIVMYLIVVVSVYICCVPVLATLPMAAVVLAIHYRAFFESSTPDGNVPPVAL